MPAIFDQLGIRFEYPDNWSVDEEVLDPTTADGEQVVVTSPNTAFWQLSKHPPEAELEDLFDEALSALRTVYQEMEVEPVSELLEDRDIGGFNVNFCCLDFTNTIWLRGFKTPGATFVLLCQAEDRELKHVGPVFLAMLASVLRNLP
jgi:hypothetical protein